VVSPACIASQRHQHVGTSGGLSATAASTLTAAVPYHPSVGDVCAAQTVVDAYHRDTVRAFHAFQAVACAVTTTILMVWPLVPSVRVGDRRGEAVQVWPRRQSSTKGHHLRPQSLPVD